jgi:hypothetical protein
VDEKVSMLEGLRTYRQSQIQKGEEEIKLGPEPTGQSSYAREKTKQVLSAL